MIPRILQNKLKQLSQVFPVVAILGPRQAGKTTLAQHVFPEYAYISLEDLEYRSYAKSDPRYFLMNYSNANGIIIDEVQHVPELLSYIQTIVDRSGLPGKFILTGSQNFLLHEQISQSLAGRIAILTLLPLSMSELQQAGKIPEYVESLIFQGCYPRIHSQNITPQDWYPNYIKTYLERDIRQIKNVTDLFVFQRFLKLCAGRIGQIVNFSDLGRDCGISYNTVKAWLSILESSYILFLLPPYYKNFSKRLIKSPKLYFYDTGLACSLLGIEAEKQVESHYLKGGLMESLVISDLIKYRLDLGLQPNCYFWKDQQGHEIDCIIEQNNRLIPIEIKSSMTIPQDCFSTLTFWNKLAESSTPCSYVIYGGTSSQLRSQGKILSWKNATSTIFTDVTHDIV